MITEHSGAGMVAPSGASSGAPFGARLFVDITQETVQTLDPFQYSQYVPAHGVGGGLGGGVGGIWPPKDAARFHQYHFRDVEQKKRKKNIKKDRNGFSPDSVFFDTDNISSDDDSFPVFANPPASPGSDSSNHPRSKNDIFDVTLAPSMPYIRSSKSRNSIFDVPPSGGPFVKPPSQAKRGGEAASRPKLVSSLGQRRSELSDRPSPLTSPSSSTSLTSSSPSYNKHVPTSPKNAIFFESARANSAMPPSMTLSQSNPPSLNTQVAPAMASSKSMRLDLPRNFSPGSFSSPPLSQLLASHPQSPPDYTLSHLIPPHEINLVLLPTRKNLLGVGRHAQVFKATYTTPQQPTPKVCAAKRLNANRESQTLGLSEAYILRRLSGMGGQHENIIMLVGVKDEASFNARPSTTDESRTSSSNAAATLPLSPQSVHITADKRAITPGCVLPVSHVLPGPSSLLDVNHTPCLVLLLEYCANGSLWDWVQENKRYIGRRLWMKWARQLSSAMERMHAIGLVHHDVKPHNILLTEMLDIKMSDFGTAMFVNATSVLEDGLGKGTLPYSPPELLATPPHPYSHPVDIFSLGVTLYVIGITGEEPFRMIRSPVELLVWVRKGGFWEWEERLRQFMTTARTPRSNSSQTPPTLSQNVDVVRFLNGEPVPTELLELLKRMVSPDPAERPTAIEVAAVLREFDGGDDRFRGGLGWSGFDVEKRGDQSLFGVEDEGAEGEKVGVLVL